MPADFTLSSQRVLVTGASGNLGAELARALAHSNTVYGSARFTNVAAKAYLEEAGVVAVKHSLGDPLDTLPREVDYVFNFGAFLSTGARSGTTIDADPDLVAKVNALAVGDMMRHWPKLKGFVQASSCAVYQTQQHPLSESDPIGAPYGTYSATKYAAEMVAHFAAEIYGVPTALLRIFSAYGPRGGLVTERMRVLVEGGELPMRAPGPSFVSPLHTDDFVRMAIASLAHAPADGVPLVLNIGGDPVTVEDYTAFMGRELGIEPKLRYDQNAIPMPVADLTKMKRLVGAPQVSIEDGIRRVIAFNYPEKRRAR